MLAGMGSAQAAIYTGRYDPDYGVPFPNLGWDATAVFNVPDACLAIGNGNNIPISGDCASFSVVSAQVDLFDISAPSTILESFSLNTNVIVTGIDIAGGALTGIDTGYFNYFIPTLAIAGGGVDSFSLILFGGNEAQLIYANPTTTSPLCGTLHFPRTDCGISADPAVGVITLTTPIPEPETYALMLVGLGVLGFVGRRRRR